MIGALGTAAVTISVIAILIVAAIAIKEARR